MKDRVALVILAVVSLGLLSFVDDNVYRLAQAYAPGLGWIAEYRVTSLAVCLFAYLISGPDRSYQPPARDTNWRMIAIVAAFWFVPQVLMVYVVHVPVPMLRTAPDFVAFLLTGLLAEELLFRGAIFQLAQRALPRTLVTVGAELPLWPIVVSALCFSLAHLQYYGFAITGASVAQVSYTMIMGLMWGTLRPLSSSMWPAVGVHVVTNLLVLPRIVQ